MPVCAILGVPADCDEMLRRLRSEEPPAEVSLSGTLAVDATIEVVEGRRLTVEGGTWTSAGGGPAFAIRSGKLVFAGATLAGPLDVHAEGEFELVGGAIADAGAVWLDGGAARLEASEIAGTAAIAVSGAGELDVAAVRVRGAAGARVGATAFAVAGRVGITGLVVEPWGEAPPLAVTGDLDLAGSAFCGGAAPAIETHRCGDCRVRETVIVQERAPSLTADGGELRAEQVTVRAAVAGPVAELGPRATLRATASLFARPDGADPVIGGGAFEPDADSFQGDAAFGPSFVTWAPEPCATPTIPLRDDPANAGFVRWPGLPGWITPESDPFGLDGDRDGTPAMWDCDDQDPDQGAREAQDGQDTDCDGDAECASDADGDCATVQVPETAGCAPPAGSCPPRAPADCDDADPGVHPGAEELPGDDVDQDCDGALLCDGGVEVPAGEACPADPTGTEPTLPGPDPADPDPTPFVVSGAGCATPGGPGAGLGVGLAALAARRRAARRSPAQPLRGR